MIGMGGMGTVHLQAFMKQTDEEKDIQVVAVSDIYTKRKQRARDIAKLTDKDVHHEYRDLLARDDVDAVLIASPDHWHGQMALDALAAGKDVYLEKPMTHTIEEARALVDAVKKYNRILQVGNQGLSAPSTHKSKEIIDGRRDRPVAVRAGDFGPQLAARASGITGWSRRARRRTSIGTAGWARRPSAPFSPDRYFRFRKYWDYSGGIATDLFFHSLGPILYPMGAQFPMQVSASGGIYVHKDREVPDTYATTIEYPNYLHRNVRLDGQCRNGPVSSPGHLRPQGDAGGRPQPGAGLSGDVSRSCAREANEPQGDPLRLSRRLSSFRRRRPQRDARTPHTTNFFACVRSRKQPNAPAEIGYKIITAIKLGVYAYREGKTKSFDPEDAEDRRQAACPAGVRRRRQEPHRRGTRLQDPVRLIVVQVGRTIHESSIGTYLPAGRARGGAGV